MLVLSAALALRAHGADSSVRYDITPYTGYVTGGAMKVRDTQLLPGNQRVGIARGGVAGFRVELPSNRKLYKWKKPFNWEGSLQFRSSVFDDKQRLFGEDPAGPLNVGNTRQLDVRILTAHAGANWNIGKTLTTAEREDGGIERYLAATGGLSYIRTRLPLRDDIRPSISGGGGIRYWVSNNFGLRFDTRATLIASPLRQSKTVPITNRDCTGVCQRTYFYPRTMFELNATIGVIWGYRP